ncbi:MAG: DUF1330 domain-containing protein [Pseudomonadota bacterium]|jgi:uncharacterized protein (DUF1330 family)
MTPPDPAGAQPRLKPCYVIAEMKVTDMPGFTTHFAPLFRSIALQRLQALGGEFVVQNTHPLDLAGQSLAPVVNIVRFPSTATAIAAYASAEMQEFDRLAGQYVQIHRTILETQ